jgi:hypothetical protein
VVLHFGHHDLVTRPENEPFRGLSDERTVAQCVGDQVDPFGGVLGEDHLVRLGTDEHRDPGPCSLIGIGGLFGELMRAAVHGRVVLFEESALSVEHLPRPLGGGARVEVDQRSTLSHGAGQDREVGADLLLLAGAEWLSG